MNNHKCVALLTVATFLSGTVFFTSRADAADGAAESTPPAQPKAGPGGASYPFGGKKVQTYGEGGLQYWLFEPVNPTPKSCPVIVFNHGWSVMEPGPYEGWIEHLVRRGNIVIYPRYQNGLFSKPNAFVDNAAAAVKDALSKLASEPGHVRPQTDKVAVVGHSAGGQVAAGLATVAQAKGLPQMKAVMCVEPGKSWGSTHMVIPLYDMSKMPASTLLLTVFGEQDFVAKDIDARRIYNESKNVPKANKNCVELMTDEHGSPPLMATHFCPVAPAPSRGSGADNLRRLQIQANGGVANAAGSGVGHTIRREFFQRHLLELRKTQPGAFAEDSEDAAPAPNALNALDYYGLWKLFDGLTDAAFFGKNRQYALGNTPEMRFMGKWSDGVPVKELKVVQ